MQELAILFKALSDETRLRIVNLLFHAGELCVCDLEDVVGGPQTKISRHLAYLRKTGIVRSRRQGLWILYSLAESDTGDQGDLLRSVEVLLRNVPRGKRDRDTLERSIRKGCCATYSFVKPQEHMEITESRKGMEQ